MKKTTIIAYIATITLACIIAVVYVVVDASRGGPEPRQLPPSPFKEITFEGNIPAGYSYTLYVSYMATKDSFKCSSYTIWGKGRDYETRHYKPIIKDGKHSITFPINVLSPTVGCKWKPQAVDLCVAAAGEREGNNCNGFIYVKRDSSNHGAVDIAKVGGDAESPINIDCIVRKGYGYWHCDYRKIGLPAKRDDVNRENGSLVLFTSGGLGEYPMDREDHYWLDFNFHSFNE